uniref:hypothetical protein n=1 Tax=Paractinoplanes polyasparticus TaxID=2856853 RepID=UPI001C85E949|nr:hypothetical protein [Actinoplanes polyasparticus]
MISIETLAYELWLRDTPANYPPAFDMVRTFLEAHGINIHGGRVPDKVEIRVTRNDDGSFQFACWLNQVDEAGGVIVCETCTSDVLKERIDVPLAAPVPVLPGARFWPAGESLDRVLPEDLGGMRAAAELSYLEQHAMNTRAEVHAFASRRDSLARFVESAQAAEVTA